MVQALLLDWKVSKQVMKGIRSYLRSHMKSKRDESGSLIAASDPCSFLGPDFEPRLQSLRAALASQSEASETKGLSPCRLQTCFNIYSHVQVTWSGSQIGI